MNIGNSAAALDEFTVDIVSSGDRTFARVDHLTFEFRIPFSREEVEHALSASSLNQASTQGLFSLGSSLFSTLFSGELGRLLWRRMAEVERLDRGLRLRILSNSERTQHLPWELMFDPSRGDFMALSGRIALVRTRPEGYKKLEGPPAPLKQLRILVATADHTLGSLQTEADIETLRELPTGLVDLTVLNNATPAELQRTLQRGKFDVFHFAGSGEVLPIVSKRGGVRQALRLLGSSDSESLLDRQLLGNLLRDAGVRLAVLNACWTDWVARSVARYIPAVIGLREDAQLDSCVRLVQSLYGSLVRSRMPLDLAVTAARQAMNLSARPGIADWCKLIFYLQQTDGTFLAPAEQTRATATNVPTQNKQYAKLLRLLDVHEANLSALTNGTGVAPAGVSSEDVAALQQKIDDIKGQLGET